MVEGGEARVESSLIRFHVAGMLHDVVKRAIQVHGAAGISADLPLERTYRDARLCDGPDEVHRLLVARELLDERLEVEALADDGQFGDRLGQLEAVESVDAQ